MTPLLLATLVAIAVLLVATRRLAGPREIELTELIRLARDYRDRRRFMEASVLLKRAIRMHPNDPLPSREYIALLVVRRRKEAAARHAALHMARWPDDTEVPDLLPKH